MKDSYRRRMRAMLGLHDEGTVPPTPQTGQPAVDAQTAQIRLLASQGKTALQISLQLGLPLSVVTAALL